MFQHSFVNPQIQDTSKAGKPSFSLIHSGCQCCTFSFPRRRKLLTSLSHTELWDAHPSHPHCWGHWACRVALSVLASSVPSIRALDKPLCIAPPILKQKRSRGSCTPGTTNQQSSPWTKTLQGRGLDSLEQGAVLGGTKPLPGLVWGAASRLHLKQDVLQPFLKRLPC